MKLRSHNNTSFLKFLVRVHVRLVYFKAIIRSVSVLTICNTQTEPEKELFHNRELLFKV